MRVFRFSRFPRLSRLFRRKTDAAVQYLRRAKAEPDPLRRLALLDRARDAAPPSDAARVGRLHAELALDLLRSRKLEWSKSETIRLARELESLGAPLAAAEAFAFAGDQDGELDALAEAGAIDTLEATVARVSDGSSGSTTSIRGSSNSTASGGAAAFSKWQPGLPHAKNASTGSHATSSGTGSPARR
jgi:hypothetical protein